jgi:acetyltransferase-like isoleucine patch superfamily enzyme
MQTNKEKMLAGELYQSFDQILSKERQEVQKLLYRLNHLEPDNFKEKSEIFNLIFSDLGKNIFIELPFKCDYGYNISIGKNFFANFNCTFLDSAPIIIGDHVLFGPNVSLFTSGHPIDVEKRKKLFQFAKPITIENNVWIGGNTVVNPGVTIGENTVIGAGSVVTKSIPANVMAAGNPCKVIRNLD